MTCTSYIQGEVCCGYGSKGTKTTGGDCINIPHLTHVTKGTHKLSAMCGGKGGLGTTSGTTAATVCSKSFFPISLGLDRDTAILITKWKI